MKKEELFRKVYISIRTKLSVLISILLLLSLTFYVFYAIDLFKKDKSAFIFETTLLHVQSLSNQYEVTLNYLYDQMMALDQIFSTKTPKIGQEVFDRNSLIFEFATFQKKTKNFKQILGVKDKNNHEKRIEIENNSKLKSVLERAERRGLAYITYLNNGHGELLMAIMSKDSTHLVVIRAYVDNLLNQARFDTHYKSILIGEDKKFLQHPDNKKLQQEISVSYQQLIKQIESENVEQGVKRVRLNGKEVLVAFKKLEKYGVWALVQIDENDAFKATSYLVKKSSMFGVFVLSISLIIGVLFSKGITSPIQILFDATKKFAGGNFNQKIEVKSSDELGVLADSFNYMSKEIVRYMDEMKEKLRLEKEVEVAKLVQESFFPPAYLKNSDVEIAAFYKPASECGGDWWGEISLESKTILIIADATGHGVPAALLTATLHSCSTMLKEISQQDENIMSSPANILNFFNKAVCETSEKILVTCFVAVVDHKEKQINYASASHNPPFLYHHSEQVSKNNFESLLSDAGPHLGKNRDFCYQDSRKSYSEGDAIILYTDGIVEGLNLQEKQWGSRRFLKSLVNNIEYQVTKSVENIVDDAFCFYEGRMNDDDVTFVIVRLM